MRIIAGKHKNRLVPTFKKADYRPSTSKFREAIFNIISSGEFSESMPIIGAKILDLFAGTGALSFEAISRGASKSTLIDINSEYLKSASEFAKKIGESNNIFTLNMDVFNLHKIGEKYDIIFIDPPYYKNHVEKTLKTILSAEVINSNGLIIIEMEKQENIKFLGEFRIVKEKIYGNNKLIILQKIYKIKKKLDYPI